MSYQDKTREELRDELKSRELPVSGTKDELIERLEEADDEDGTDDADGKGDNEESSDKNEGADDGNGGGDGEDDDKDSDASGEADSSSKGSGGSGGLKPMQLARLAGAQLMQLTGRQIDGTAGIENTDEGWRVLLEVVEVTRVPRAMDLLGLYEVIVDDDGDLVRYERLRRYARSQQDDGA